jgi:hypothetical protein
MRIDVEKGHEDEGAAMHLWMRQNEPPAQAPPGWPTEAPATMVDDVDVEGARPPMRAEAPASLPFDALDKPQQRRGCRIGADKQYSVEVGWLPSRTQWRRGIDA